MSSARARPGKNVRANRPAEEPTQGALESAASVDARRLAAEMERALADGELDLLTPQALQELMAAVCRTYSAQVEAGRPILPLAERTKVTSTDIMTTASGLLKSGNLAVFELGMWQSWTGR
jgi:hypothetical protein